MEKINHHIRENGKNWYENECINDFCESLQDSIILCDNAIEDLQIWYEECDVLKSKLEILTKISEFAFKKDLEDNTLHRSWQHRWLNHLPAYIDWQIQQEEEWSVKDTELNLEMRLTKNNEITIVGRIDRVDVRQDSHSIIDYKTGYSAKQQDVDSGEDVQLTTYALLDEDAEQVAYLSLDKSDGSVKTGAILNDETLVTLKHAVKTRLETMLDMTTKGHSLTAWGDAGVCSYCNFSGLCRHRNWEI